MTYVMSDLHGMYDRFIAMLEKIDFSDSDELFIIGDIIDRGERPVDILEYVMDKPNITVLLVIMILWLNLLYINITAVFRL